MTSTPTGRATGRVYNDNPFEATDDIMNECVEAVLVSIIGPCPELAGMAALLAERPSVIMTEAYATASGAEEPDCPVQRASRVIAALPETATVIDPFAGDGAVVIAAQRMGRDWRAIERDVVACSRLVDLLATDRECEAYLLSDGMWQCGNCGEVFKSIGTACPGCGAVIVSAVGEGDPDGIAGEAWEGEE